MNERERRFRYGRLYLGPIIVSVEWKPQDCWVGLFWRRSLDGLQWVHTDIWVCLIPMLPIHLTITSDATEADLRKLGI